ncbi:hypothetical protein H310_07499 [Aphanomyces invadans]|uniref:ABC transmembrane type-1 domain-containing protein n=1 Tax=Aphanomyces invadans TaxID=157072 RepID=A0A024U1H5_9STRA|nr:hypothetical protein H310_07499 [Aphanomyces invadans]ETW00070.1 hypothetical protein H310_07499 [Aphanomyces invadans]|eukprot:XP_008871095.1 hypothetical protein H310_07499 [Aphanomyces invadans]
MVSSSMASKRSTTVAATSSYQTLPAADDHSRLATVHPHDEAGLLSKLFLHWATPLLKLGNQRQLNPADLWPLQRENQCHIVSASFEPTFRRTRSLVRTIFYTYGWRFAVIGGLQILSVGCTLYGPVVLKKILTALEDSSVGFDQHAVLVYIATLFGANVAQAFLSAHSTFQNQLVTVKLTSALQHLLFRKSLALDAKCRREKTTGEIANMFSADIQWILNFSIFATQLWLIPIQVAVTLVMLYDVVGWATFVGAGVIVFVLVVNNYVVVAQRRCFVRLRQCQDARMKSVNEVFGAMQIIKLNAWEDKFQDKIAAERNVELETLWRIFSLSSCVTALLR